MKLIWEIHVLDLCVKGWVLLKVLAPFAASSLQLQGSSHLEGI